MPWMGLGIGIGNSVAVFVAAVLGRLLMEDGSFFLMEDGTSHFLLEA